MRKKKNKGRKTLRKIAPLIVAVLGLGLAVLGYAALRPSLFSPVPASVKLVEFCDLKSSCHETGRPYQNPALPTDARVEDLLARMTIAEKIGQMTLIEKKSITRSDDIARYGLGALLSGAGARPDDNTPEGWLGMVNGFQKESQKTRLGIPLLYGVDANHGHGNIPGATFFPHAIGLAATKDADLVRAVAKATAEEVAATGINWVFSPDLDIVQDTRWGRTYETFGSDPKLVGLLGGAFVEGLQSANRNGLKIAASAKHYVGNGSTVWGSSTNEDYSIDQGNSNISDAEMRKTHLEPFRPSVAANVKTVMVGLNRWNGEKVTFNKYLLTDVLRGELGFQGFTFSDWYGVYEKERNNARALVDAVNAGLDMIMLPFDYKSFSDDMHRAVANGEITRARLDEAVRRILKVKFELGLFDAPLTDQTHFDATGSEANKNLARTAVRKSLVSLKNNGALPLARAPEQLILVSGSAANNLGMQSGGWTVEWQGIDGNWIPGTTILKGIQDAASSFANVKYDEKARFTGLRSLADVGIAVVGEKPYSEGVGDKERPALSVEDLKTIKDLKKASKKIIVVIISGRPLDIKAYARDWDVVIAAWLPGTEGRGVADVLFGDFPITGVLPVDWNL